MTYRLEICRMDGLERRLGKTTVRVCDTEAETIELLDMTLDMADLMPEPFQFDVFGPDERLLLSYRSQGSAGTQEHSSDAEPLLSLTLHS